MTDLRCTVKTLCCCGMMAVILKSCFAQTRNDSVRLMEDMLQGYDRKHRPILNQSDAVDVHISFSVVSLQDVDELGGTFSVVLVLFINWIDEVIHWDPASYGGITSQLYYVEDIWYPILVLASSSGIFRDLTEKWMNLRIYNTGQVLYAPGLLSKSTCSVDVKYFPFDRQICQIKLTSWGESVNEVRLVAQEPFADDTHYSENGEWNIVQNSTYVTTYGELTILHLELLLERKPLFAVTNTIVPMIIMSVLNMMVFVLPAESGERVSFSITVLLAMTVFLTLVADTLPSTSESMSILAFFLLASLIISALICIAVILNLRVHHRSGDHSLTSWQRCIVRLFRCNTKATKYSKPDDDSVQGQVTTAEAPEEEMSWPTVASAVDTLLLFVFSTAFVINIAVFVILLAAR